MNHPDLYFPSHRPDTRAQNKATGKKLCSSPALPVFSKGGGRRISKPASDLLCRNTVCATDEELNIQVRHAGTTSSIFSINKVNIKFTSLIQRAHFMQLGISVLQNLVTQLDGTTRAARPAPLPSSPAFTLSQFPSPKVFTNLKEFIPMSPVQAGKFNPFYGWTGKRN